MMNRETPGSTFDTLTYYALIALVVVTPLLVIPTPAAPFQFTKMFAMASLTLFGLMFFVATRLQRRDFVLPLHPVFFTAWLLPLAYFLSTLFSSTTTLSFAGARLQQDSFVFVALAAIAFSLAAVSLRSKARLLMIHFAMLATFFVVVLFHFAQFALGADAISFGIFGRAGEGPLGSVGALGMFAGLIAVLSLMTIVGLRVRGPLRILLPIALVLSLFILMVANVSVAWWLVGVVALGAFVFSVMSLPGYRQGRPVEEDQSREDISLRQPDSGGMFASLIVLGIAIAFLFGSQQLTNSFGAFFGVGELTVSPSWSATVEIAKHTLGESPLFGSGPGTFAQQWAEHRPPELNDTIAWNVDFNNGIGFIPTSVVTTGLLGAAAWLVFLGAFLFTGVRTLLLRGIGDSFSFYLTLSTFVGSAYLWILALLANPSPVLVLFAFILSGMFVASLRRRPEGLAERRVSFVESPRLGFITVLLLTIVVLGSVAAIFAIATRYAAAVYAQNSAVILQAGGSLDAAGNRIDRALSIHPTDDALRFAVTIDLARLSRLAAQVQNPTQEERSRFQGILSRAIQRAEEATRLNPNRYQNWLALGRVYAAVVPLGIEDTYDNAKQAYEQAKELRPQSPAILVEEGRLDFSAGNRDGAEALAREALTLRRTYTDAMFLLAQIQIQEGNLQEAIASVEQATLLTGNNPVPHFQLGLLRYASEDYQGAADALSDAISINDEYANARYFRGLARYRLGRTQSAIDDFERIREGNPNNEEVARILANMRAGRDPFVDKQVSTQVEEFTEPPLVEGGEAPTQAESAQE